MGLVMSNRSTFVWTFAAVVLLDGAAWGQEVVPPREVRVLRVFFVPKGERTPTADQDRRLWRHLEWSRARYRELLGNRDTFAIEGGKARVYRAERPLSFYREQPEMAAPQVVSELLAGLEVNRYNAPYILLVVLMNPEDHFPVGGGRPLNGGYGTGGGIVVLSSFSLDRSPNFQSTLQHELGHAFGLPHVDAYLYDMKSNNSIMSYNPNHHTNGFTPSRTPGGMIPEDIRGLALNRRAFPKLRFDPEQDVPKGYTMAGLVTLGPMTIPGQPDGVTVTTDSGEEFGSKVGNIVQGRIGASKKTGEVTFDSGTMWQSAKATDGWVSVDVTFPDEVTLTRLAVHSQHSGIYHAAEAVRVLVRDSGEGFREVAEAALKSVDDTVNLPETKGRGWRFQFRAGPSGIVVLRGLQFFSGDDELFPPLVPYEP